MFNIIGLCIGGVILLGLLTITFAMCKVASDADDWLEAEAYKEAQKERETE